jgi:hypothetical protein
MATAEIIRSKQETPQYLVDLNHQIQAQEEATAERDQDRARKTRASSKLMTLQSPVLNQVQKTPSPPTPPTPPVVPAIPSLSPDMVKQFNEQMQLLVAQAQQVTSILQKMAQDKNVQDLYAKQSTANGTTKQSIVDNSQQSLVVQMVIYMSVMIAAQVKLTDTQAKGVQAGTDTANDMEVVSNEQAQQAMDLQIQIWNAEYAAAHQSFWDQVSNLFKSIGDLFELAAKAVGTFLEMAVTWNPQQAADDMEISDTGKQFLQHMALSNGMFQDFLAVLMILGGAIMGGPAGVALALSGAFALGMQTSGGQQAMDNGINSVTGGKLWAKILMDAGIAIGEAVAIGGLAGAWGTAFDSGASAGTSGAAGGGAGAGTGAAGSAAGDAASAAAASSAQAASTEAQTTLQRFWQILQQVGKNGVGSWKGLFYKSIIAATTTPLWSDLFRAILEGVNRIPGISQTGDNTMDEASAIGGAVLGAVMTLGAALLDNPMTATQPLKKWLTDETLANLQNSLLTAQAAMMAMESASNIVVGVNQLHIADITEQLGDIQGTQGLTSDFTVMMTSTIQMLTDTLKTTEQNMASACSGWDETFVAPYDHA